MKTRLDAACARLTAAFAGASLALAAALAAGLAGTVPAQAATQAEPVCATWQMRGATGAHPDVTFGGPPEGSTVAAGSAKLVKPATGVQPGVEFAAFNLNIEAPADNEVLVGVDYATADGATTVAGAIRLFGYNVKNADTLNDAPTYGPAVAAAESGHLVLTVPAGEKLGTLGMVYDASNSSIGSVMFSGMTIGNRPVQFTACPQPTATLTATPSTPSTTPTATAPVPTAEPTVSAAPVPTLPVTGSSSLGWLALAGACALGSGALLLVLSRRRRTSFEA